MAAPSASTGGRFHDVDFELDREDLADGPGLDWPASNFAFDASAPDAPIGRRRPAPEKPAPGKPAQDRPARTKSTPERDSAAPTDLDAAARERACAVVERLVLPRLRLAHGLPTRKVRLAEIDRRDWRSTDKAARAFAEYALACDAAAIERHVDRLLQAGWTLEGVFFDLFEPSARRLGWLWENDLCGFVDVSLAVGRMSAAGRKIAAQNRAAPKPTGAPRRLLIAAAPGETHRFGADLVAEMCRRHGWDVAAPSGLAADDLCALAAAERFDAVGLSLADSRRSDACADLIRRLRRRARDSNGRMSGFIVGGAAFNQDPALALQVGADAMASNARTAPRQLADLLDLLDQRV